MRDAIDSVLAQTFQPFEIIVLDDCSNDGSQELIKQYSKNFKIIKPIFNEKNIGISQVRKKALNAVSGEFVTYLDGDDIYLSNKLELESNLIKKYNCDFSFSNNMYVDPEDLNDVKWIWADDQIDILDQKHFFFKTLTRDFPRSNLFRMELIRYEMLKGVGFHDENLEIYEDYDLRIRLAKKSIPKYTLEPTSKIRISKNGLSKKDRKIHLKSFYYIFNKYLPEVNKLESGDQFLVKTKLNNLLLELGERKEDLPFKIPNLSSKQRLRNILKRF